MSQKKVVFREGTNQKEVGSFVKKKEEVGSYP